MRSTDELTDTSTNIIKHNKHIPTNIFLLLPALHPSQLSLSCILQLPLNMMALILATAESSGTRDQLIVGISVEDM